MDSCKSWHVQIIFATIAIGLVSATAEISTYNQSPSQFIDLTVSSNHDSVFKRAGSTILTPAQEYKNILKTKQIAWFTIMGVWVSIAVVSTTAYFTILRNTAEFKFKSKAMTWVVIINGLIYATHTMASEALVLHYPCFLRIWLGYCLIMIYAFSLLIRGIAYISQITTIRYKNELSLLLSQTNKNISENQLQSMNSFKSKSALVKYFRFIFNKEYLSTIKDKQDEIEFRLISSNKIIDMTRDRNYLIFCACVFLFGTGLSGYFSTFDSYKLSPISYVCPAGITAPTVFIYVVLFSSCLGFLPIIFLCSGSKDAYGIRNELITTMTVSTVGIIALATYNQTASLKSLVYASGFLFTLPIFILQHIFIIIMPLISYMRNIKHNINRTELNSANSSRKEQFESLLSYPAGFSRLNQAALETFCPENVEFLKDYQLLKYCVCSYIFRESADAINFKESSTTQVNSFGSDNEDEDEDETEINYKAYQSSLCVGSVDEFETDTEVHLDQLIGGDIIPPLPVTICDSVYTLGLMLDLNLINQSEGKREKNIPKFTRIPNRLIEEFMKFFSKYLEQDTLLAVNVPVKVLLPIREAVSIEKFTVGMFDEALQEVLNNLYTNTYPIMLKTL